MQTKRGCLTGLGRLRILDDELFMQVLSLLPADALGRLACVNKALYCFANHEDLWRALTLQASCPYFTPLLEVTHLYTWQSYWLSSNAPMPSSSREAPSALILHCSCFLLQLQNESLESHWRFERSWQHTFLRATHKVGKLQKRTPLQIKGFYSDLLYQPWHCSTAPLRKSWLKQDTIDRRADLSVEDFKTQYELPNRPVIIQHAVSVLLSDPLMQACSITISRSLPIMHASCLL